MTAGDKITLDVGQVATRARAIALDHAKGLAGLTVGPQSAWFEDVLRFLCVRDALREIEPNPIQQIFDKVKADIGKPDTATG